MHKNIIILLILLITTGCAVKGRQMTPDYSLRDFAMLSFLDKVETKYGQFWYDELTKKELKELKKVNKIKPRMVLEKQVVLSGIGAESARFDEYTEVHKNEPIDLPDFIQIPNP